MYVNKGVNMTQKLKIIKVLKYGCSLQTFSWLNCNKSEDMASGDQKCMKQ